MTIQERIKSAAKATELLADRIDGIMKDIERQSDSATNLPTSFDDLLFAHDKLREAQYTLQAK